MMQLIVLGQVPGTHFQITFGWFQLFFWPLLIGALLVAYRLHAKKSAEQTQHQYEVISLRSLEQA